MKTYINDGSDGHEMLGTSNMAIGLFNADATDVDMCKWVSECLFTAAILFTIAIAKLDKCDFDIERIGRSKTGKSEHYIALCKIFEPMLVAMCECHGIDPRHVDLIHLLNVTSKKTARKKG